MKTHRTRLECSNPWFFRKTLSSFRLSISFSLFLSLGCWGNCCEVIQQSWLSLLNWQSTIAITHMMIWSYNLTSLSSLNGTNNFLNVGRKLKMILSKLKEKFKMITKMRAKMVPKHLIQEYNDNHKNIFSGFMERLTETVHILTNVNTCDETWIFQYESKTKLQLMLWKTPRLLRYQKC